MAAERDGATFVTFSPVYPTASRGGSKLRPQGLDRLSEVCRALRIPVLALGGITAGRVHEVIGAGADGVALVSAITEAEQIEDASREIVRLTRSAGREEISS
jgi:thiamine-phosphate pyrophosphorylase